MKSFFIAILLLSVATVKSQSTPKSILSIPFDHTLGYISNIDRPIILPMCQFPFEQDEKDLSIFIVENLSMSDFHNLIDKKDNKSISRVKLWQQGYQVKENDFLFRYNRNNELQFYYIVKDKKKA